MSEREHEMTQTALAHSTLKSLHSLIVMFTPVQNKSVFCN